MTLEELSKYIDVSRQTMSRYETDAIKGVPSDKNSARLQPCGTKGKGARNEDLFPPIIKQIDERGKRMAKQKDGRYRA